MNDNDVQRPSRWRPSWAWFPVVMIGIAIIPNVTMLLIAREVGTESVLPDAYAQADKFDDQARARQRFQASGLQLSTTKTRDGLVLRLAGPIEGLAAVRVTCYRPDAVADDRQTDWPAADEALPLPLGSGLWYVTVIATLDGQAVRRRVSVMR